MTTEEKAKAYDDALEKAKVHINIKGVGDTVDLCKHLFPQLCDSEDEKIRKFLIKLVNDGLIRFSDSLSKIDVLAYLEKQKEQKPNLDTRWENGSMVCEQKEQKPTEWSRQSIIDALTKWLTEKIVPLHKKSLDGIITKREEMFMAALLEIRSLVNSPDFQIGKNTSAEWSEEDEKTFWGLTAYIPDEELKRLGVTRLDILKKLKSIRPQPIQLKEAYKEGFQTARYVIALAFMNYLDENRSDGKMCLSNGECEDIDKAFKVGDWAKIMRYYEKYRSSWKPSEEQMRHLHYALTSGSPFDLDILKELYEQLKKL